MASSDLFVTNDSVANGIGCPLGISGICKDILFSSEDGDWNLADVLNWNLVSDLLLAMVEDISVIIGPNLESILSNVLSIVEKSLD